MTLASTVATELVATYPPPFPKGEVNRLAAMGVRYEEVAFSTADGLTLRGWYIPAEQPAAPAVIYAPGTSEDQRSGLPLIPAFQQAGYQLLLFSYRGYGLSEGSKGGFTYGDSESRDLDAAVRFLCETKGASQVVVLGHSVGAASAIISAARNPSIAAVVAIAPFNSLVELWQTSRPPLVPRFLLDITLWLTELRKSFRRDDVYPLRVVHRLAPRPLLLIYGTDDCHITERQARRLYAAAKSPKALWLVEGATHNGVRLVALEKLAPDIIAFLDQALRDPTGGAIASSPSLTTKAIPL